MQSTRLHTASGLNLARPATEVMGFYRSRILPQILDLSERMPGVEAARQRAVEYAGGHVLEIGSGLGSTLMYYSGEITSLTTVDPNPALNARARRRLRHVPFPVDVREGRGENLPVKDAAFDCVVSTFTLCCVDNLDRVAAEIYRVLKPGGRFHFVEIGLSEDPSEARWQRRLSRLQRVFVDGCRLDMALGAALTGAGLAVKRLEMTRLERLPRPLGCAWEGLAVREA